LHLVGILFPRVVNICDGPLECVTNCCVVCFVSYVLFVCKRVLLPPGDNPIAVNKYIISNRRTDLGLCIHVYRGRRIVSGWLTM